MVLTMRQGEQCDSPVFPIAPNKPAADRVAGRRNGVQRARDGIAAPRTLLPSNSKQRFALVHVNVTAGGGRIPAGRLQACNSKTAQE
jgi:hypothetical protein